MANKPKPSVKIQFLPLNIDADRYASGQRSKFVVSYNRKRIVFCEKSGPIQPAYRSASEYINSDGAITDSNLTDESEKQIASFHSFRRIYLLVALEMAIKANEWETMGKTDFEKFIELHKTEIAREALKRTSGEAEAKRFERTMRRLRNEQQG